MKKRAVFAILSALLTATAITMGVYGITEIKDTSPDTPAEKSETTEGLGTASVQINGKGDTNPAPLPAGEEHKADRENDTDATKFLNRPFIESEWTEVKATWYCPCVKCCGKWAVGRPLHEDGTEIVYGYYGAELKDGISIASNNLPCGTVVEIYGLGTRIVQDRGLCHDGIDIYCTNHEEALSHGMETFYIREITK